MSGRVEISCTSISGILLRPAPKSLFQPEHIDDGRPLRSQLIFDQNCDYRDMVGAVDEVNHWGSDLTPGKKRRR